MKSAPTKSGLRYVLMQLLTAIFIAKLPEVNYLDREEEARKRFTLSKRKAQEDVNKEIDRRSAMALQKRSPGRVRSQESNSGPPNP